MQNVNKINGKKQYLMHWTCMDVVIQNFGCLSWPTNVKTDKPELHQFLKMLLLFVGHTNA